MPSQTDLFVPIKSKRAFEEISIKIKESILNGVLKSGEKLPSETKLAHQFDVSRHTIREALRVLELSGLLTIKKGVNGGPIITNTITNTIGNLYLDAFQMEKITLEELTTARLEIERCILNRVIDNIKESDIRKLQENINKAKKKLENGIMATEENIQFHRLLANASKNHVFIIVAESISTVLGNFLRRIRPDTETSINVVEFHEKILDAITKKNRDKAINLLEKHLLDVKKRLQIFIDREKVNI